MKNKTYLFLGALIMGMTLTPIWAQEAEAAKLAASLNALKAKSAVAEGATVRLTGEARLTKSLAVPSGVTLDITAEKASLSLQGGAKLTVDGVVNARGHGDAGKGWVNGGLRVDGGPAVISGSGAINLASKGSLLNIHKGSKKFTLDGVTLIGLKDNDRSLVQVGEGGAFILKSGRVTGNTYIGTDEWPAGGGVFVHKGTFTMEGGEISGNSIYGSVKLSFGGGVALREGSVFTMKNGKISDNVANGISGAFSGGVDIRGNSVFTMEGGEISGNSATGKEWCQAGGVGVSGGYEGSPGTFIMSGGIISGNNIRSKDAKGGGVMVEGAIFTMQDGVISGNNASGSQSFGGGVYVGQGNAAFTMFGGRIQGNTDEGGFAKNTVDSPRAGAAIFVNANYKLPVVAKWGTGGAYTKGGAAQSGGSDIGNSDDTLIAVPKGKR